MYLRAIISHQTEKLESEKSIKTQKRTCGKLIKHSFDVIATSHNIIIKPLKLIGVLLEEKR